MCGVHENQPAGDAGRDGREERRDDESDLVECHAIEDGHLVNWY